MDDIVPTGSLIGPATAELRSATSLARSGSCSESVERDLLERVAELGQLAGWVCDDAGQHVRAERFYLTGAQAAREAGNRPLVAHCLSSLAYGMASRGEVDDAVSIARAAVTNAPDATVREQVLFRDRLAWAAARRGDGHECERVLGEVGELLDNDTADDGPDLTYWVGRDESEIMAARCWTELHRPLRAVPRLTAILARYDTSHIRERALYTSWLAQALVDANELDAAAEAFATVTELARQCGSDRVQQRAELVAEKLAAGSAG